MAHPGIRTMGVTGANRGGLIALMNPFVQDVAAGTCRRQGWPGSAYSVSKGGLNARTRIMAGEMEGTALAGTRRVSRLGGHGNGRAGCSPNPRQGRGYAGLGCHAAR